MNNIYKILLSITILLSVSTQVSSQSPNWSVTPGSYSYSMTITGVANIEGTELTSENDMVAAFYDDKCRGVTSAIYNSSVDRYMFYITIYSNTNSEIVSFKTYNASSGKVYNIEATIDYEIDAIIGQINKPYVWANPAINGQADILAFSIAGQQGETVIENNNVSVLMPSGSDFSALIPEFELSLYAIAEVGEDVQISGQSQLDFTTTVEYLITGVNFQEQKTYLVNVINNDVANINANKIMTPNGDGLNDTWIVHNNLMYRNCNVYIYSREGLLVYQSYGYNNDWDGRYNGKELPVGVYFFVIECPNCRNCKINGAISIIR